MARVRLLLTLSVLAILATGCATLRDADYVDQDVRGSASPGMQPLVEFFDEHGVTVQSRRVTPPTRSTAVEVYDVQVRFENRPNALTVYVYANEAAATQERQRFDYGQRERTRRRTRVLSGREAVTVLPEQAPAYQQGSVVVVVRQRDGGLERALRQRFGPPIR